MFKLSKQIQGISIIENKTFLRISTLVSVDVKTSDKEFPGGTQHTLNVPGGGIAEEMFCIRNSA